MARSRNPERMRAWSVEHQLAPYLRELFAADPRLQSVLVCVAEYLDRDLDERTGAHLRFVYSLSDRPVWPHVCPLSALKAREAARIAAEVSGPPWPAPTLEALHAGDLCSECVDAVLGLQPFVTLDPPDRGLGGTWDSERDARAAWGPLCPPDGTFAPALLARRHGVSFKLSPA